MSVTKKSFVTNTHTFVYIYTLHTLIMNKDSNSIYEENGVSRFNLL